MRGVVQVRLSVCVSYEECSVVVSLLERVSVWCWAGPSVYVCVSYEECRLAVGLLERFGLPDSECVVLGRFVYVCVSYEECRVAVDLPERVSVSCWAGPSVSMCVCHTRNAE